MTGQLCCLFIVLRGAFCAWAVACPRGPCPLIQIADRAAWQPLRRAVYAPRGNALPDLIPAGGRRTDRSGLAAGDRVQSWTTSNKKVATVTSRGKITAKKTGKARIIITLASGKKAVVNVTVQKTAVKTTKISGLKRSVVLKRRQKLTLKPVISPITSVEKVTYKTSNKKVATVNSRGVITAKKKGTAKITVKSGKKTYTVTVKVK